MLNPLPLAPALLLLVASPAATPDRVSMLDWDALVQQSQHIVIHVPNVMVTRTTIITRSTMTAPVAPPPPRMSYREKKTDDCLSVQRIAGFSVSRPDSVDLMLSDGSMRRAVLDKNCQALGFYSGFYVKPNRDGKMCASRDSIRSRAGRTCNITGFKALIPAK
jgi:hypothetical protein